MGPFLFLKAFMIFKEAEVVTSQTDHGLKVCYSSGPGVLRLWIPFKHQLFIEYSRNFKNPMDVYGDISELDRNPKYLALVTKTFDQILIKDNKLEVQIKLDPEELKIQSKKKSHPELNHWLEEMAQILIAYNQGISQRSLALPLKIDKLTSWNFKYFYLTIPVLAAIAFPLISSSIFTMVEWKDKIELLVGFGFFFGGLLIMLKVRLWLRIFTRLYILLLSGLTLAFVLMELSRRFSH
jgi:hypothetical protein